MEAFSLLKYWRTGGGGGPGGATATAFAAAKATTKTIVDGAAGAGVSPYSSESEDGPYFDLEFALPDHESDTDEQEQTTAELQENDVVKTEDETESEEISVHENDDEEEEEEEDEAELKFSLTTNECTDQNAALSPSDDLFFKGDLVTIEPSSILLNGAEEENPKFPVFLGKSASKFRVLLLKLKKSKSVNGENPETPDSSGTPPKTVERENQGKTTSGKFFVKFKVEEAPPLVNLFTRDNSSKEIHGKAPTKQSGGGGVEDSEANSVADERKLSKEVMNKYFKMVKPFYIRVSKRYVEKLKFPGGGGGGSKSCAAALSPEGNVKNSQQKQGKNLQAGLKVVRKHLGKSRSASASAAAAPPASDRRDDSLLQLQDGIQGAILHCKKSFNASRDVDSSSILCRSVSDPSHEKCVTLPKFSRASSSISGSEAKKSGLDNI